MKATEKDADEKRLQRNAYKRQWYARLSDGQKELARKKRTDKYVASKKILPIDRIACSRSTQTPQAYAHQNKGIFIKDMVDEELAGEGTQRELSGTASYKGKAKISNDTYGLGSQPSHANTYAHSLEQYTPLRRGNNDTSSCRFSNIPDASGRAHYSYHFRCARRN